MSAVVVVISASCAGYGACKSFFEKLFSLNNNNKLNCEGKKYSHVNIDAYCFERALQ